MAVSAARRAKVRIGAAASLALHVAIVTTAILSLPHWRTPLEPRGVEVRLVPLTPLPSVMTRPEAPRPAPSERPAPAALSQAPSAPVPTPAAPAAQPPAAGDDAEARAKLAGVLRGSFGCSEESFLHLSQKELDRCAKWRRAQLKPGLEIPAPIEHNKRAWFDATVAARNEPDHGPGIICLVKPAHGLKLGPLPCYVEPPKGSLSQDVDAPPEPEHSH